MSVRQFFRSLSYALRGVRVVFQTEQSFRIQSSVAIVVILAAIFFHVRWFEWVILLILIASVLSLELINSIIERLVDAFKPRLHPVVHDVKDMMAGAVLLVSFVALIIGGIIFWPYVTPIVWVLVGG